MFGAIEHQPSSKIQPNGRSGARCGTSSEKLTVGTQNPSVKRVAIMIIGKLFMVVVVQT